MLLLVAALMTLLPLLAALQYRWLGQVSEGERERLQSSLSAGANRFSQDFDRELTRAYQRFQMDAATLQGHAWGAFAERYDRWFDEAPYARLVKDVFLVEGEGEQLHLAHFDPAQKRFEPQDWPAEFASLRQRVEARAKRSDSARERIEQEIQTIQSQIGVSIRGAVEKQARGSGIFTKAVIHIAPEPLLEDLPALLIPIISPPVAKDGLAAALIAPLGYTVVTLNLDYLQHEFFPVLAKRYLYNGDHLDYNLAVASRADPRKIIYQLGTPLPAEALATGDVTVSLGSLRFDEPDNLLFDMLPRPKEQSGSGNVAYLRGDRLAVKSFRNLPIESPWQLVVKHRTGSLEAAVASTRRRSLMISFGILLLLAVSVALVIISTRRAQRLAEQQMEFVSAVSHELRTPLAVIRSAGENLADGVIDDRQQVRRYGALIQSEGRRLTEMVEQVLEFAGAQSGRQNYELRPVQVGEVVETVLAACQSLVAEGGFTVDTQIQPYLPPVMADAAALRNSIQNLLSNAMKYGGEQRWVGLKAQSVAGERGREVRITVEDHGLGISPADLPHIFEPFYRGREVAAAQIHGNGLGLSLVKRIIEAHGGRVSVESVPTRGSAFTLHLPVMAPAGEVSGKPESILDSELKIQN